MFNKGQKLMPLFFIQFSWGRSEIILYISALTLHHPVPQSGMGTSFLWTTLKKALYFQNKWEWKLVKKRSRVCSSEFEWVSLTRKTWRPWEVVKQKKLSSEERSEFAQHEVVVYLDLASCRKYNEFRLNQTGNPIIHIPSRYSKSAPRGIESKLSLSIGTPVVLLKNLNVNLGLFNGTS